jgi:hypothetical protein
MAGRVVSGFGRVCVLVAALVDRGNTQHAVGFPKLTRRDSDSQNRMLEGNTAAERAAVALLTGRRIVHHQIAADDRVAIDRADDRPRPRHPRPSPRPKGSLTRHPLDSDRVFDENRRFAISSPGRRARSQPAARSPMMADGIGGVHLHVFSDKEPTRRAGRRLVLGGVSRSFGPDRTASD